MSVLVTQLPYAAPTLAITAWAEEDRPREKLILKGRQNLSDAELLAILLGSGSRSESAVALAQRILQTVGNDLQELGKQNRSELMAFHGVGEAKAVTILAALELGRRRQLTPLRERPQVRSSNDAYQNLFPILAELEHENAGCSASTAPTTSCSA